MQNRKRDTDVLTDFWTLWEKARVGCFERTALKHVYYLGRNRSPAQVGCMRQVLGPGVLGRPRGIGWRGMWEGGVGWGIHVYPRLIHVNVWQKPLQYCKVISLQLIKKKKEKKRVFHSLLWSTVKGFGIVNKAEVEVKRKQTNKKGLNDLDNHNGVVTHLEPDILECEA